MRNGGFDWDDGRIAEAVECGASTVYRVRLAFVEAGLGTALLTGQQIHCGDSAVLVDAAICRIPTLFSAT